MEVTQLTEQEKSIIGQLEALWRSSQDISSDTLKSITEMLLQFPDTYKTIGLQKIAEHSISAINLHILSLMALLQREASAEGIDSQELAETLEQVQPVLFQIIDRLSKDLSLSSLDDLAVLSNIVISLQTLSRTHSAQEAQSWLYELPTMCYQQLSQEHLLKEAQNPVGTVRQNWISSGTHVEITHERLFVSASDLHVSYTLPAKHPDYLFTSALRRNNQNNLAYTA